ncbi:MAG: class A beta-lactamase-related serine hydrolase [Treponema sp.]|nr:class A beta-lactamase-related serine hydrolase [Treponema sp.]
MKREEFETRIKALGDKPGGKTAVSLLELKSGESYGHNEDWVLDNPASTIKLGIMCAALFKVQEGKATLEDKIICKKEDKVPGSGILQHLSNDTVLPLKDMIMLMIIQSDNTATNILMDYLGFDYINEFYDKQGLKDTRLRRKLFDMEASKKGIFNNISARDLSKFLFDLEKRTYLNEEHAKIGLDILLKQQIKYKIPKYITSYWNDEGEWFSYPIKTATKSGETSKVEHDCGIIYTPNSTIILSVLTNGTYPPEGIEYIGRVAELSVRYFDSDCLTKTYKKE